MNRYYIPARVSKFGTFLGCIPQQEVFAKASEKYRCGGVYD